MELLDSAFTVKLSIKDVSILLTALYTAAVKSSVQMIPWDSCSFYRAHKELSRITGYGTGEHEHLTRDLKAKWSPEQQEGGK
jgi:hypothetical protein